MESFILVSECWKFGSLDMEWPMPVLRFSSVRDVLVSDRSKWNNKQEANFAHTNKYR
jgi:hypothetical protein